MDDAGTQVWCPVEHTCVMHVDDRGRDTGSGVTRPRSTASWRELVLGGATTVNGAPISASPFTIVDDGMVVLSMLSENGKIAAVVGWVVIDRVGYATHELLDSRTRCASRHDISLSKESSKGPTGTSSWSVSQSAITELGR